MMIGAGSAMGPLHFLLSLGATVIAVAQGRTLTRILKEARHSPGRVLFPVRRGSGWQKMLEAGDMDSLSKAIISSLLLTIVIILLILTILMITDSNNDSNNNTNNNDSNATYYYRVAISTVIIIIIIVIIEQ